MRLVVFSYKHCWASATSPSGYATHGGFPFQMRAVSQLFDETTLVLPRKLTPPPAGLVDLEGPGLRVETFAEPPGSGLRRKLAWLLGGLIWLPLLWRQAGRADAVHAVVPGDVGFAGLIVALLRRRRVFVRHCGTWGRPTTLADRLLHHVLVRVAGDRCVVLATGGGDSPPSPENPAVRWIFSTSLSEAELAALPEPSSGNGGAFGEDGPRLISIGRLSEGKNVAASIRALARLRPDHPKVRLDVLGDGSELEKLVALADELDVRDSVTFHGNVDHEAVLQRLRRAHVLVFPTRVAEGFPKAVLEALACGVPVVVPRVSVLPHLLEHGGGVLLPDVSPESVAEAVAGLLVDDVAYAEHSRRAGDIARQYTLEAWRDAIGEYLEGAWGQPLGGARRDEEAS